MDRRLAAILATDVVGFSRLIRADEEGTIAALKHLRSELVDPKISAHHGRIVKLMGDGMLAEFPSVVEAVRAAVETQQAVADHNSGLPVDKRIEFRVGINLGDVVIDGDDIHGDGVNVASRLEGISGPGGICVSGKVYEEVRDRMDLAFEDMGEQVVKNISRPLRVWRWLPDGRLSAAAGPPKTAELAPPDIRDPEFENWVRDRRQELSWAGTGARDDDDHPTRPTMELASMSVGGEVYGKYILQSIANGVSEFGSVDIGWANDPEVEISEGALRLEFAESEAGDFVVARLQLVTGVKRNISWQITANLLRAEAPQTNLQISRIVSEGVDRTIDALSQWRHPVLKGPYTSLFRPIQDMLRTKGLDYRLLRKNFQDCFELEPRGIYLAWQAFLVCFILGERRGTNLFELKDEARSLIRRALELEPHNSLVLALASNVYGLALNEFEVGHELAERSVRLNPNSTLGWTFLGNAKLYRNECEEAYQILLQARDISGEGPYRHLVDCVTCIAAILSGRLDEGIAIGETVNAISPDFRPALRYLLAAYISKDDLDGARNAFERLRKIEPNFELSYFADPDYPVPALRASGLLDLDHLPNLF